MQRQDLPLIRLNRTLDTILQLPVDIFIIICKHLDPTDVIVVCRVSKCWRSSLSSERIYDHLIKAYFRNYYELNNIPTHYAENVLRALALEQWKRQRSVYYSTAVYSYDIQDGQEYNIHSNNYYKTYYGGRVAWRSGAEIKVTTLSTGITRPYFMSDSTSVSKFWLGTTLLVAEHGLNLYVWLLDTTTTFDVKIPYSVKYITLSDNRIGIVTQRNVIIWTRGNGKQTLLRCFSHPEPTPEALLFHPTSQDTVVLASRQNFSPTEFNKGFVMRVFLHEYVKGIMKNNASIDIPYSEHPNTTINVKFDVRAIDDTGAYSICWVNPTSYDLSKVHRGCNSKHCTGDAKFNHLLCYNIYWNELTMQCFTRGLASGDNMELRVPSQAVYSQVWAGQMLTPVSASLGCRRRFLLQTVIAHDKVSVNPPAIHYIDAFGVAKQEFVEDYPCNKQNQTDGLLSYLVYDVTPCLNQEQYSSALWSRLIRGDGKYLVLLAERGYVVWCLDEGTTLPSNQSPRGIL